MNLKGFISKARKADWPKSAYVEEPEFSHLYVRYGRKFLLGAWHDNFLDIANVEAVSPGNGAFSRLLEKVQADWPDTGIYVECVLNARFAAWLLRWGFESNGLILSPSFYLLRARLSLLGEELPLIPNLSLVLHR